MLSNRDVQYLNEVLVQEELLQAKTKHMTQIVTDKQILDLLNKINAQSCKSHTKIMEFIEEQMGM